MTHTVNLKLKEKQGEETVVKTIPHEIERLKGTQILKVIGVARQIITKLSDDNNLQEFIDQTFGGDFNFDPDAPEEITEEIDAQFLFKLVGSIDILMDFAPDKVFELISVMSGIERSLLEEQDAYDILDIYDAVIEENDIEKLYNRVKKSLETTMKALKFLQKRRQATAE